MATTTDLTCPLCGLACDDLSAVEESGALQVDTACAKGVAFFGAAWTAPPAGPARNGEPVTRDAAIDHAATLLNRARLPLFGGLAVDVAGARAAVALTERSRGVLDHADGDALSRNVRVIQDSGCFTTTLSEVRNRADCLIVVGAHLFERFPRLLERVVAPAGLFIRGPRRLYLIGPWDTQSTPPPMPGVEITVIPMPLADSLSAASWLRAALCGHLLDHDGVDPALTTLADHLRSAQYTVIAWATSEFNFPHAELTVEAWSELARDLNRTGRAAALPLGGALGSLTAQQVCNWQTGWPLRTSFAAGAPEHDAWRFSAQRLLDSGEADLLVWIAALEPLPPPATGLPRIVIGHPALAHVTDAEVFLPTGIPGMDHAGHCVRTDGVVTLPLKRLREPRWPSTAETLNAILERLPPC